jgi:alkylhydroperoxidase family enzyme
MTQHNKELERIQQRELYILGKPPRIAPITEEDDETRTLQVEKPPGYENKRTEFLATLMHNRAFVKSYRDIMTYFLARGTLAARDRELAILRTAWLRQVPFIWGEHVNHGKKAGMTSEEIEWVRQGSGAQGWSERDRAILRAAEELIQDSMISDSTWETLSKTLDDALLVELIACVGQYQVLGYLQNSLRIPLFEGSPGLAAK